MILIKAEAGAGKSTVLRRVAADLAVDWERPVLALRGNTQLDFGLVDSVSRLMDGRLFVIVDDAPDHAKEISEFVGHARRASSNITIIAAARANEWAERGTQFPLPPVTAFDLPYLGEAEINGLLAKLEQFDALGALAGLSEEERRNEFRKRAEFQLLVALREATEGKNRLFDDIIRDEFDSIPSEEARTAYLFICSVYQARVPLRAGVLRRLTNIPFEEFKARLLDPTQRIIVEDTDEFGMSYRARHPVIAQIVARYRLGSAAEQLSVFKSILALLDLGYEEDLQAYRKISRNRTLVEALGTYELKTQFYDACRQVDESDPIVAQHWAILAMNNGRLDRAEALLGEAQRLAPRDPSIQHSVGMLAFARYRKRTGGPAWERMHFERAEEVFTRLIRRAPTQVASYDSLSRLYQEHGERAKSLEDRVEWYGKAHDLLQTGIRETFEKSQLHAADARLQDRIGEFDDAEEAFSRALAANPMNTSARYLFAMFLLKRKRADDAIEAIREGLNYDNDARRLRHTLALAYVVAEKKHDEITEQFRLAIGTVVLHWLASYDYAVYLYLSGQEREAKEIFEELKGLDLDFWEKKRTRANPFVDRFDLARKGKIVQLHDSFGFVQLEGKAVEVYLDRYGLSPAVDALVGVGKEITFRLRFNLHGPAAASVKLV